jgi:hypothetical protein
MKFVRLHPKLHHNPTVSLETESRQQMALSMLYILLVLLAAVVVVVISLTAGYVVDNLTDSRVLSAIAIVCVALVGFMAIRYRDDCWRYALHHPGELVIIALLGYVCRQLNDLIDVLAKLLSGRSGQHDFGDMQPSSGFGSAQSYDDSVMARAMAQGHPYSAADRLDDPQGFTRDTRPADWPG